MLDAEVYESIKRTAGERGVGMYISNVMRPLVSKRLRTEGYKELAADKTRLQEAAQWESVDTELTDENTWQL